MSVPARIEEISQEQFWDRIDSIAARRRIPVEAMFELTYGCNLRCVHCYNPTHKARGELNTEHCLRIIDQLAAQGCLKIAFTGGELFTRNDWFEIASYAKDSGFALVFLTNATLITPEVANRIEALSPKRFEVSIYGATRRTYERVTRVPGSYRRFLRGVGLLRRRQVPLLIKMPVMTLNADEVGKARALVESWGIKFVYCTEIFPRVDGSREPLQFRLSPEQVVRVTEQMGGYRRWKPEGGGEEEKSCGGNPNGLFTCKCGKTSLAVTPYGQLNLCVSLPIPKYDLQVGSVAEGWPQLVGLVEEANSSPGPAYECPSCALSDDCRQGPMNAWFETGDLSPCLPYFKELAALEKGAREPAGAAVNHDGEPCRGSQRPLPGGDERDR